jgi:hypothetical protein
LASSPFFSTPYEGVSHGNSSNKKMTKGISTKREEHVSSSGEKNLTLTKAAQEERAEAMQGERKGWEGLVTVAVFIEET